MYIFRGLAAVAALLVVGACSDESITAPVAPTFMPPQDVEAAGMLTVDVHYDERGRGLIFYNPPRLPVGVYIQLEGSSSQMLLEPYRPVPLTPGRYVVTIGQAGQYLSYKGIGYGLNQLSAPLDLANATAEERSVIIDVRAGEMVPVRFAVYDLLPALARPLGFWTGPEGEQVFNAWFGPMALQMLRELHLRNADGTDFDPWTYQQLHQWLRKANARNMAYMLSAQLAVMKLNWASGAFNAGAYIHGISYSFTYVDLGAEADLVLSSQSLTRGGDPARHYQTNLKDWLHDLNDGTARLIYLGLYIVP